MGTLIKNLQIKNFKSVRDLSLDCDRINIFIGKPNAGKSNILEAISLLGAEYSEGRFMKEFIRYDTLEQMFSDFNYRVPLKISVDGMCAELKADEMGNDFIFSIDSATANSDAKNHEFAQSSVTGYFIYPVTERLLLDGSKQQIDEKPLYNAGLRAAKLRKTSKISRVKKYEFKSLKDYKEKGLFLQPPYGENFYFITLTHAKLKEEISDFLRPNGLELLLDMSSQRMSVVQKTESNLISFPFNLVPDTLQRYIFHLAAILSNHDSVLLFEEPESHSYAPYIYQLAQHILNDEQNNQYFLTTHNPYLLTPILQETKDVALFITWFEDYQTHARRLSEEEVGNILSYGLDVFLNLNHFIPE